MAKKIDPQAKAKRQKIIAAVLGVLLLGVLAFQLPRTLKMLHQSSASASTTPTTPAATGTTGASGALAATAGSTSGASGDGLNDPAVPPAPQSGQLLAFSRFRSKDPFTQQINLEQAGATSGSSTGATTVQPSGKQTTTPAGTKSSTVPSSGASAAKKGSAEISVNGNAESITVGAKFPASNPTFVLVSLSKSWARIGIAGGSLQGSKQTVTLKKGVPLTLMNTADGTRYVLRLVSAG